MVVVVEEGAGRRVGGLTGTFEGDEERTGVRAKGSEWRGSENGFWI